MKKIFLIFLLTTSTNSYSSDLKFEECTNLLGAGLYNRYLERKCNFDGNVGQIINNIYAEGNCRQTVPQTVVDELIKAVGIDVENLIKQHGIKKFCSDNRKGYYELLK